MANLALIPLNFEMLGELLKLPDDVRIIGGECDIARQRLQLVVEGEGLPVPHHSNGSRLNYVAPQYRAIKHSWDEILFDGFHFTG